MTTTMTNSPRKLTRDEFVQIFGMQPEEYKSKHPDRVQPLNPEKPKQRRFYDDPAVQEAVRPFVMGNDTPTQPHVTAADKVGIDTPLMPDFVDRGMSNAVAGVLATPTSVAGLAGLLQHGVPALVNGAMSKDEQKGYFGRVADEFMNGLIPEEDINRLAEMQMAAQEQFKQQNPHATEEDAQKFLDWYVKSDEFYDATVAVLPKALNIAVRGQDAANRLAGTGTRSDQMTAGDEAMQIIGGAFVGLPAKAVNQITRPIVRALGERVANHAATRIAARTLEAATPITLPLTPGNIALNAGVGVAINEGIRGLTGDETLIDYNNLYDPTKFPAPETLGAITGLSAAAIFGLPSISKVVSEEVARVATLRARNIGQTAGPSLEEQSDALTPQLSPITGLADQNAPVKKGAQLFKAADDTETVPQLDAAMSAASTVNRVEAENNALNYGILEGLGRNTVPYAEVRAIYDRLDPQTMDVFDKYVYAVQRKQDSAIYEKSLIDQVTRAHADIQAARLSGNTNSLNAAQKRYVEVQQKYTAFQQDDPTSRSSMQHWSKQDVENFIKAGESVPQVKQLADAVRQISRDEVEFLHKNGIINAEEAARRLKTRELYVPLQERARPNATGLKRRALLYKDRMFSGRDGNAEQGFFINTAPRDVTEAGAAVNMPKSAIVAVQEGIMDAVRSVAANNARREVIDTLDALPGARGKLLRPYEFKVGNGRTTTSISQSQYASLYPRGIPNEDNYIKVFRNGNIELWEFGDKSITKSLQFAPIASVPIANATRKIWQTMTTGLAAPWFAAKTFLWDAPLAQTTKNAGRSLGLMDTYARRLLQGTALEQPVGAVLDRLFDPTVFAAAGVAIPYQLGMRAARAVGTKVATDLASNSGVFNAIYKSGPQGKAFVEGVGTFMVNAFDQSALGVMSRHMSTSLSHLNDVSKIADDFAQAAVKHAGPVGHTLQMYKAMLDSVHMATKTAFFMSNYGRLKAMHNGQVPAKELKKLVQETRNLTGDMSRQSNSKLIQQITSVIPYSNAMLQGTRHILSAAVPQQAAKAVNAVGGNMLTDRNTRFWHQFTSGVILPTLGSLSVLSQWEGAEDFWHNKVPKWQQMTGIPVPSIDAIVTRVQTGEWPKFSPDKLNIVPISPEFSLIREPVLAGLRAMGMLGSAPVRVPQQWSDQLKDVMDQVTGFSTPPILSAILASSGNRLDLHSLLTGQGGISPVRNIPSGGANADMMTTNSNIPQTVYDVIGALAGSAAQIAMQTLNVADISYRESEDAWEAADDALDTAGFEIRRRLPQIDVPGLFKSRERLYQSTPESEYVYKTEDALEPIIGSGRQMSVERDTSGRAATHEAVGLVAAQKIRDPNLKGIATLLYNNLGRKGPYKAAKDATADLRAMLPALEASRYKMADNKYNEQRNLIIKQIQQHTRTQADVLQGLERQLQKQLGRRFIQQYGVPFSYKALSDLIREDVAR
jgi:hypothetical protein